MVWKSVLWSFSTLDTDYLKLFRTEASHASLGDLLSSRLLTGLHWVYLWWKPSLWKSLLPVSKHFMFLLFKNEDFSMEDFLLSPLSRFCILSSLVRVFVQLSFKKEPRTHLSSLNKVSVQLLPRANQGYSSLTSHSQAHSAWEEAQTPSFLPFWVKEERKKYCKKNLINTRNKVEGLTMRSGTHRV